MKSTQHMCTVVPQIQNFRPFRSTISRFQDIAHFRIFPLTYMLKFQRVTKFSILVDRQNIYNFTFTDDCLIYHKVWLRSDQKCRSSSI